jgi:DNA gyrase subunit A
LTERNGEVIAVRHVHPGDGVVVITEGGILIRMAVDGIRQISRTTQGVRLIRMYEDDKVTAVARIVEDGDAEEVELTAPLNEDGDNGDEGDFDESDDDADDLIATADDDDDEEGEEDPGEGSDDES